MSVKYKTELKKKYLLVHTEGTTDEPDELLEYIDSLLAEPQSQSVDRFLLDHRDLRFERFNAGTYDVAVRSIKRIAQARPHKVAILARPERMEYARVYETIGLADGVQVKAFERLKIASVWLAS